MIPDLPILLLLGVLGGVLALDGTSFGQFMLSRPLIAAVLAGIVTGSPQAGIVIGVLLEALQLAVLPVGAARYPEAAPAAVASAGAYAGAAVDVPVALMAAVVFSMAWGRVGGTTVEWLRRTNVGIAVPGDATVSPGELERMHLKALGLDFVRGAVVTVAGLLVLGTLLETLGWIPFQEHWTRPALALSAAGARVSSLRLFGRRRLPLFLAGAAAGLGVLWLR